MSIASNVSPPNVSLSGFKQISTILNTAISPLQQQEISSICKREKMMRNADFKHGMHRASICSRAVKLWRISGFKRTKRSLNYSHNVFLQFIIYPQQSDIWTENPAMKKQVIKISTLTALFNLDPEVVFHTNDVTLNSSILMKNRTWHGRGTVWLKGMVSSS
jgi:hypothetical protein